MKHIGRLIGVLCLILLTGCASNKELKQEEVAWQLLEPIQEEVIEEDIPLNKDEEVAVEEEIVIEGVTYIIRHDYLSSLSNSTQLLKLEEEGKRVVLDEGGAIQLMPRGSSFYTSVYKMVGEEPERYIKKYSGNTDNKGQKILEDIVNFTDNSIAIKGHSSGRGLWCVVEEQSNRVIILNEEDEIVFDQVLNPELEEAFRLEPYAWSYGSKYLWCLSLGTYNVEYYTIIDTENFEVTQIKKEQPYQDDYAIDCNNGWIAYSDMPVILDIDEREAFMTSGKAITLYLENLFSKEKIIVNTSITKAFNPKWADKYTLQYDNPKGDGYLTYKLPLASDLDHLGEVVSILLESTEFLRECKEDTERLGEARVVEITGSIIKRLEEAQAILGNYEFYLKNSKFQEAIDYFESTASLLLQEATFINEGRGEEALLDIREIEGEIIEVGHQANSYIDRTY